MKKFIILFLTVILSFSMYSQNSISKKKVQNFFKELIVQKKNGKFSIPSSESLIFNDIDSSYYKKDTIIAFRYKSKHKDLCKSVNWTFYKKNTFIRSSSSLCKEPPTNSVSKYPDDYYTIAVYNVENEIMFDVLRYDKMIMESFKVILVEESEEYSKITLYRRL
ncbi:hypothetical protein [Flavobacterium salmonis]|uniref:Lipocalin-like domain-containing protein n=1 Tax=Flavobacterium salmonis TaxID=2654844 RepID=A0A6V6ZD69_9FLAO|nr:hypothetical protein [Flavobacterium salmonis]CAD0009751.1 hypothetical protein FLAT13_05078 [Flavobacterium salmonis]